MDGDQREGTSHLGSHKSLEGRAHLWSQLLPKKECAVCKGWGEDEGCWEKGLLRPALQTGRGTEGERKGKGGEQAAKATNKPGGREGSRSG